jgi:anti-sigma factor RsiW
MSCEHWREKLDAYSDGELAPSDSTELARHLAHCADCTKSVLENVQMKRSVATAGRRYVPSAAFRANVMQRVSKDRPREHRWAWQVILIPAALILLAAVGLNLYVGREKARRDRIYSELADLHVSTLASSNPVDVLSTDRHTVKPWFEGKLPFSFNLPELQGTEFSLLGGRVTYLGQTPGAQLIYKLHKHEVSVFIFQSRAEAAASTSSAAVQKFSFEVENWTKNGLSYFVVGDVSANDIESLSKLFRDAG